MDDKKKKDEEEIENEEYGTKGGESIMDDMEEEDIDKEMENK